MSYLTFSQILIICIERHPEIKGRLNIGKEGNSRVNSNFSKSISD